MSKGFQVALGASVVGALLVWYAATSGGGAAFAYYQDLEQFRLSEAASLGRPARVHGYVLPGSIARDVPGRSVRFDIVAEPPHAGGEGRSPLSVVYASLETPDLFGDGAEVVVEGALADAVFRADRVMAKCPSKFEAADPTQAAAL